MRNNINISKSLNPQGILICPVCGKEFEANDDTKYIINGGYVCDWKKCFLKEAKRREAEKEEKAKNKNNKK